MKFFQINQTPDRQIVPALDSYQARTSQDPRADHLFQDLRRSLLKTDRSGEKWLGEWARNVNREIQPALQVGKFLALAGRSVVKFFERCADPRPCVYITKQERYDMGYADSDLF